MNMRTIFQAILVAIALSSCNADVKTEALSKSINLTAVNNSDAQSAHFAQATAHQHHLVMRRSPLTVIQSTAV